MPINTEIPQLDSRSFETIKQNALLRIPRYTPEWTDWNESDPGITLVELFAWLTEMMLYEMNRVPERNYLKFLQTLGLDLRPAQPATVYLTFSPQPGVPAMPNVPELTQVGAQPAGGGDQLVFETRAGLSLIRLALTDVQVFDGAAFTVVTSANTKPGTGFRPFGWQPVPGSALYLGFTQSNPPLEDQIFPQEMRWRVFLPLNQIDQPPVICETVTPQPVPPVNLVWEFRPRANPNYWRRLQVFEDQSAAFTREGAILVEGPTQPAMTAEGRVPEERIWIRIRLADGAFPAGTAPLIDFLRPNVVEAENLATIRGEPLGTSDGLQNQTFRLQFRPLVKESLVLGITEGENPEEIWVRKDDLLASGENDPHFTVNTDGEIRFGDGINGRIPVAGAQVVAREYRYGGGQAGNVTAGLANSLLTPVTGIDTVKNERPGVGGRDEQSLTEFIKFAPAQLRCRDRAVSEEDFTALARQVGGIANAVALPLFHPDHPGVEVPGALTIVVVPDTADRPPRPSPDQLEKVCEYIDSRRLLTSEIYIKGPEYLPVRVEAILEANPYAAFDLVENEAVQALNDALDPLVPERGATVKPGITPRRKVGRAFGLDFYPTSLFSTLQNVKDVKAIRNLTVRINGMELPLNNPFRLKADQMLYGVLDHTITVVPYKDL
jgi:predicted phage baseplate assembly protein